jgi:hypothetical protein
VHAAGRRGHGKDFKALAVELGLTGPMTATIASLELLDFINWTLLPQLGKYPHGAITGRGEILAPPPSQATSRSSCGPTTGRRNSRRGLLKADCPECGYAIRLSKRWAEVGLPSCPTDGAALALNGAGEAAEAEGVQVLAPAPVRLA